MTVSVAEKPLEKIIRPLLSKHGLARVEMRVTERTIYVAAIPTAYHPLLADRTREAMLAAAPDGSIGLAEATRIRTKVVSTPLAEAYGDTLQDALASLAKELKTLK